jgi:hypothetical protein
MMAKDCSPGATNRLAVSIQAVSKTFLEANILLTAILSISFLTRINQTSATNRAAMKLMRIQVLSKSQIWIRVLDLSSILVMVFNQRWPAMGIETLLSKTLACLLQVDKWILALLSSQPQRLVWIL